MNAASTAWQRRLSPLFVLGLLFSSLFVAVMLPATPAAADHGGSHGGALDIVPGSNGTTGPGGPVVGSPPPYTPGGSTPGGGGAPSGGSGSGGSGGQGIPHTWSQGGQGFFPRQPPSRLGGTTDPWAPYSNVYRYNGRCNGNFSWSANGGNYSAPYIGWSWSLAGDYDTTSFSVPNPDGLDDFTVNILRDATSGGYECIEPPQYFDYTIRCAAFGTATLLGPVYNSSVVGAPTQNLPRQDSAFEAGGRTNPALCEGSRVFPFESLVREWGQYELRGVAHVRRCTFREYYTADQRTGDIPDPEVIGCGDTFRENPDVARLELFCEAPYLHRQWHNTHSFTTEDCMGENSSWSCGPQVDENPTFNGQSLGAGRDNFGVLDDGKYRRGSWATVQPTGDLRNITNRQAMLRFIEGSPYRVGESKNGDTQPFIINPPNDAGMRSGWRQASTNNSRTAWDLQFQAAGIADNPFTVRPRWAFRAEFLSYVPSITWDLATNSYSYTLRPVWIPADAQCDGQPLQVDVSRARNSTS